MNKHLVFVLVALVILGAAGVALSRRSAQPVKTPAGGDRESTLVANQTTEESKPQEISESSKSTVVLPKDITLQVTQPGNGAVVTSATVTVRGKTAPRAEVFVNDSETVADASGNFSVVLTLDEGENPIVIFANDADGKTAEEEMTVTYNPS